MWGAQYLCLHFTLMMLLQVNSGIRLWLIIRRNINHALLPSKTYCQMMGHAYLWIASRVSACICRRRSPGLHIGSISSTRLDASALWQGCFRIGSRRADMGSDLLALRGGPAVLLASRRASTILL